jgi:site-specific DNA-cytosine methylase
MNKLNLKKIALTGSILLASAASVAAPMSSGGNYVSRVNHKVVSIDAASSKQQAYELGAEKLAEFERMTGQELSSELVSGRIYGSARNSTHLKEHGYVTVQERLNNQGQLEYVAQVHMSVHYQERDSNN